MNECRCIQNHLKSTHPGSDQSRDIARLFDHLLSEGKVGAALRLLTATRKGGVLPLDSLVPSGFDSSGNPLFKTTKEILQEKHPQGRVASQDSLLDTSSDTPCFDPILFDSLDACVIKRAAFHTHGAAGPSGVDAFAWQRLCSSFGDASVGLCNSLASVARCLATSEIDPTFLAPFVACRLIPLDKNPGVRPIGIGDVPRRILAKAILYCIGDDIAEAAGPLQVCAGQVAGCEAAIHAMRDLFCDDRAEAALLVDASNAFNSVNRQAALHNISILCPALSMVLHNTYGAPTHLFVTGQGEISSREGTTQGDPLAMSMYALAMVPLIRKLHSTVPDASQVWFADDATAVGPVSKLLEWWHHLVSVGPAFGYFPNSSKTFLIVKPEYLSHAESLFANPNITVTVQGQRHLGAALGSRAFAEEYVSRKVTDWIDEISQLSEIAQTRPHSAYCTFTHGLIGRWTYVMRTIPDIAPLLAPLEDAIRLRLIPALTGYASCSPILRNLLSLPCRLGGMGIVNPMDIADSQFDASVRVTASLKELILNQSLTASPPDVRSIKADVHSHRRSITKVKAQEVYAKLSQPLQRAMDLNSEKGSSSWLTVLPFHDQGFHLNKREFWDAIHLRYGWTLPNIPDHCVCGESFSPDHAMICRHGGLTFVRHNEIRDITAEWLDRVCHDVVVEPPLQPLTGENVIPATANRKDDARADIHACGFWGRRQSAFFDVRVFHPNARSYRNSNISAVYRRQEMMKKREYGDRVREVELASFTPLVFSTTGGMGREGNVFYKRLASLLADKQGWAYGTTMSWIRCVLTFSLLRSAVMCIRGSRSIRFRSSSSSPEMGLAMSPPDV